MNQVLVGAIAINFNKSLGRNNLSKPSWAVDCLRKSINSTISILILHLIDSTFEFYQYYIYLLL